MVLFLLLACGCSQTPSENRLDGQTLDGGIVDAALECTVALDCVGMAKCEGPGLCVSLSEEDQTCLAAQCDPNGEMCFIGIAGVAAVTGPCEPFPTNCVPSIANNCCYPVTRPGSSRTCGQLPDGTFIVTEALPE